MATPDTDPEVFDQVVEFAGEIGMEPAPLRKEKAGYVLNSLLVQFLNAAAELAGDGYAEPADVDTVCRLAAWLKAVYIDQGKLGVATGEGFYTYPAK